MIGQTITASRKYSAAAIVLLCVAIALLGIAVVTINLHWAMAALLPVALSATLWRYGDADFACTVIESGLRVDSSQAQISFHEIQALSIAGKPYHPDARKFSAGDIHLIYADGSLTIPSNINVDVRQLYRFLLEQTPKTGEVQVNPELAEHLRREVDLFGSDRVFVYRARNTLNSKATSSAVKAVGVGTLIAGGLWIIAPMIYAFSKSIHNIEMDDLYGWFGGGTAALFFGGLVLLASRVESPISRRIKNWPQSCVVISPGGIALKQGDLKGVMRWDELVDIKPVYGAFGQDALGRGIQLKVAGAQIVVEDIYNRPLPKIEDLIRRYWRPTAT